MRACLVCSTIVFYLCVGEPLPLREAHVALCLPTQKGYEVNHTSHVELLCPTSIISTVAGWRLLVHDVLLSQSL